MSKKSKLRKLGLSRSNEARNLEIVDRQTGDMSQRGLRELVSVGGVNSDWQINTLTSDSEIWQNAYLLTARMRDLFQCNPIFIKYRELLWANVFGSNGIMLRMKITETNDRVVYSADEKSYLVAWERRINRLRNFAANKAGTNAEEYRAFHLADNLERSKLDDVIRGKASVLVGQPDLYANMIFEAGWKDWQRAEYCDTRKSRGYNSMRQLRLINGARDGDCFIRHIEDPKVNKYGYTQQLISAEWCDRFYNSILPNGNVVIMGIEYQMSPWGIGEPVAYYFIKRQPMDWQFSVPGSFNFSSGNMHERIAAREIIHYCRAVDAEGTRPAPWAASAIPSARQLDQAMLAEVIAWRESACKTGFLYSDIMPQGGFQAGDFTPPNVKKSLPPQGLSPGEVHALEYGVKFQANDPMHPNSNVDQFRKSEGRNIAAGMPGGDYNTLFNDLENINFSAGRLGRLDTNEMSMNLQEWDIAKAERPTFERWQEMALITGAIPLPLAKKEKFRRPVFQGRRWAQVDEVKAANASALRIANKQRSRTKEAADLGIDFSENAIEMAEEEMMLEELGLSTITTAEQVPIPTVLEDDDEAADDAATSTNKPEAKPAKKKKNLDPEV